MVRTLYWKKEAVYILDQRQLPGRIVYIRCVRPGQVARAIRDMAVRGAPAIGVTAAYGAALAVRVNDTGQSGRSRFAAACRMLARTRPTAVNLAWALTRMTELFDAYPKNKRDLRRHLVSAAHRIYQADIDTNKMIGAYGAGLLPKKSLVLTHCNAGALATAGWGTALGVIRSAFRQGRIRKVFVDETRPYLQGARLTAWELRQEHIPAVLLTDNMAGHIMKTERPYAVIVGADRIAANGDTANKIGTYSLAVLARFHGVQFYVAAPASTFDLSLPSGDGIPIEERSSWEVTHLRGISIAPRGMKALHPAFDVTPAGLIDAIITERGIIRRPTRKKLLRMLAK